MSRIPPSSYKRHSYSVLPDTGDNDVKPLSATAAIRATQAGHTGLAVTTPVREQRRQADRRKQDRRRADSQGAKRLFDTRSHRDRRTGERRRKAGEGRAGRRSSRGIDIKV
ncbi:MAG TPA: hypothetical protein ENK40_03320 [Gammaproteobacteria bacterium]|nr:hypothetical protein [Gammaproteobacteria bacterium]